MTINMPQTLSAGLPCSEYVLNSPAYELICLSPHLDDAALSCGGLIGASRSKNLRVLVVTLFAGVTQPPFSPLAQYFHLLWKSEGKDLYLVRKAEERKAMEVLKADYVWLDCPEIIYRDRSLLNWQQVSSDTAKPAEDPIFSDICAYLSILQQTYPMAHILAPLGVGGHRDHRVVSEAALRTVAASNLFFYEDFPYTIWSPASAAELAARRGLVADEVDITGFLDLRIQATQVYASQIAALFAGSQDVSRATRVATAKGTGGFVERYWRRIEQPTITP